jgi:hypothetical protein
VTVVPPCFMYYYYNYLFIINYRVYKVYTISLQYFIVPHVLSSANCAIYTVTNDSHTCVLWLYICKDNIVCYMYPYQCSMSDDFLTILYILLRSSTSSGLCTYKMDLRNIRNEWMNGWTATALTVKHTLTIILNYECNLSKPQIFIHRNVTHLQAYHKFSSKSFVLSPLS